MITPSCAVLRTLLAQYATARIEHAEQPGPRTARQLADVSYTLCVITNARSLTAALTVADALLQRAEQAGLPTPQETAPAGR
ncbi:DUF5133 domain-containing protein [Streptomyces sp. NPDC046716]|uniref:DUF5133 domain-containing protein n=1 Tax=Streptomyces sp. NPDC046716 TaxID=3157093 RepID=UPI0033CFE669